MRTTLEVLTVATLLTLAEGASAACSVASAKGVWGFSYDSIDLQAQSSCAGIGLMTFTPATNLSRSTVKITAQRESCNGDAAKTFAASGTYTVASICTGKSTNLKYNSSDPGSKLDFNIVEAGTRLQFILVLSNGVTLRGDAVKR